jgi:hypothetical protein
MIRSYDHLKEPGHAKTPPAPRLRNSKIHTTRREIGEKHYTAKSGHQTNLNTTDTNARKERP